jgi:flagellar basal-body rod modification protein FlgD
MPITALDPSITNITSNPALGATATPSTLAQKNAAGSEDRFLKLLVAQMQNQDPLNPLDNAQVTSQMAQINTVSGVEKLNKTMTGLTSQFLQMQTLQGAALVGRDVTVAGNSVSIAGDVGQGAFDLASDASATKVEVLRPDGTVLDTLQLGPQKGGRVNFEWAAKGAAQGTGAQSDIRFRVIATNNTAPVAATAYMRDKVVAVNMGGDTLNLELQRSGSVAYTQVKSFN